MGLRKWILRSAVLGAVFWMGCHYLDKKVETIDKRLEHRLSDEERAKIRYMVKENPRLAVDSIKVILDESNVTDVMKEIPREKVVDGMKRSLSLEEKLYVVKEFAGYEFRRACNFLYNTIERKVRE